MNVIFILEDNIQVAYYFIEVSMVMSAIVIVVLWWIVLVFIGNEVDLWSLIIYQCPFWQSLSWAV